MLKQDALKNKVEDLLAYAKKQGATDAEVSVSTDKGFSVSVRKQAVEKVEFQSGKDVCITVYRGKRTGSASTTDMSQKALRATVDAACRIAHYADEDPFAGLAEEKWLAKTCPDLDLYHPWDLGTEQAIELAKQVESAGLAEDARITNSEGSDVSSYQGVFCYGNTKGFIGGYPSSRHDIGCVLIAKDQGKMERDYDYTTARDPKDLHKASSVGRRAAKRTVARLGARSIATQKAPVIFEADLASSLLGCFISAISGGNLYRKSSFLLDHLGKQVFPAFVQLQEKPFLPKGLASAPFDHDGVACRENHILENGVIQNYLLGVYSARKLGMEPTGNGGGIHNAIMSHSNDDLPALLKTMHKGFLVTELMGHGVNLVTGDYSQGAAGFWVENGTIQYPISGVSIAGNLRDMFANVVKISNDVDNRHRILTGSILLEEMMLAGE